MLVTGCGSGGKVAPPPPAVTYTIGGAIVGLNGAGLVLQDNGGNNLTVSQGATSFSFATPVSSGGAYSVTVLTQPLDEVCTVSNGSGTAAANVASVSITCAQLYTIGGTISGLTGSGLVLQNEGGDNLTVNANSTSFVFATPVGLGSAYKVTVLTQPTGQVCAVTNGSGSVAGNVTNVSVVCSQSFTINGVITGLGKAGLVLEDNGGDNLTVDANATHFTFATALPSNSAYSVTVFTQPAGESCAVSNGSGTATANVSSVNIVCVGDWTWVAGSDVLGFNGGQPGVYGTLGTPGAANIPSGRNQSASWTDASGNLWLFGGSGSDSQGADGELNDMWKFDPKLGTSGEWTWVTGSNVLAPPISSQYAAGQPGVYGTLGTPSPTNVPGGRDEMMRWTDASGNLWLFGGDGIDSVGNYGFQNDLWKFDPTLGTNGEWTWMGGNNVSRDFSGVNGVYGTLGVADPANLPGGRYGGVTWTDASGNLWLFGGEGADSINGDTYLNDLWKYTPGANATAGAWTWMGGTSSNQGIAPGIVVGSSGVYGTLGVADPANFPGGRSYGMSWIDSSGNVWLFGGLGKDSVGTTGFLNDLWMFNPRLGSMGEWTWMGGSNVIGASTSPYTSNGGAPGVYGILGTTAAANTPGARFGAVYWIDASGNLWLSGGMGYDWAGTYGDLNDLWKYTPGAEGNPGSWTWMSGSEAIPHDSNPAVPGGSPGVYGTLGTAAPTNAVGSRHGAMIWTDSSAKVWLFGGDGRDSVGTSGYLNDMWQYQP